MWPNYWCIGDKLAMVMWYSFMNSKIGVFLYDLYLLKFSYSNMSMHIFIYVNVKGNTI